MNTIKSGAKGSFAHAVHMAVAMGQQYVGVKKKLFAPGRTSKNCHRSIFGHQMAAREGVVNTWVGTSHTCYLKSWHT